MMKRVIRSTGAVLLSVISCMLVLFVLLGLLFIWSDAEGWTYYETITTSTEYYGECFGNLDNDTPSDVIFSFFPEKLDDGWSDVNYYYKAQRPGKYACEAWLDFTLQESNMYDQHYQSLHCWGNPTEFAFNTEFDVWVVSNELEVYEREDNHHVWSAIDEAKIGLILCDDENRRFVYVAILVADGGTAGTDELNYFFSRFDIDPIEYQQIINHLNTNAAEGIAGISNKHDDMARRPDNRFT